MTKNPLRVGCSPLTNTIYAGRLNAAGDTWAGDKHDVTSDCLGAVIQYVGADHVATVNENGVPTWKITVRRADAGPTPNEARLAAALERMVIMHHKMMGKTNVGASFYDAETIQEMNEAPTQARQALAQHKGEKT